MHHFDAISREVTPSLLSTEGEHGGRWVVSTCAASAQVGLLAAGGFTGELLLRRLPSAEQREEESAAWASSVADSAARAAGPQPRGTPPLPWKLEGVSTRGSVHFCRLSRADNSITNAIEMSASAPLAGGGPLLLCSNNDGGLRGLDATTLRPLSLWRYPSDASGPGGVPVNCTSLSPDARLALVVGDQLEALLVDGVSGAVVERLEGHQDYSFSAAWHPEGRLFATGSQDQTTRVWDVRCTGRGSLCSLRAQLGAVRSLRFSPDGGKVLAVAEAADFVHLVDVGSGFAQEQTIDVFGELTGTAFSPDGAQSLFVGVSDARFGVMLEYTAAKPERELYDLQW